MYGLDDYETIGNQVLLKLDITKGKKSSLIGVKDEKDKASKWMEVVKIGPLVTSVEVGDIVIMGDPRTTGMAHMEFAEEAYSQVSEHSLIGKVPLGKAKLVEMIKP